jgi:hypothetical protein
MPRFHFDLFLSAFTNRDETRKALIRNHPELDTEKALIKARS